MSNLWRGLEAVPSGAAVAAEWQRELGDEFAGAQRTLFSRTSAEAEAYPCPAGCGCAHRIVRHDDMIVAVCECEERCCDDLKLTPADTVLWEANPAKLGRAIAKALGCDAREAGLGMRGARQIASFAGAALPVVLVIESDGESFHRTIIELVARLGERFIVLAPTNRFFDAKVKEVLAKARAGFFDLESNVTLMASGVLHARQTGGALFSSLLPEQEETVSEEAMRQAYARLLLAFDGEKPGRKGPLKSVFAAYCRKGLSAEDTAIKCKCSKATVILRLAELKRIAHVPADKLRTYLHLFESVDDSLRDPRARRIQRDAQTDGIEDDDREG